MMDVCGKVGISIFRLSDINLYSILMVGVKPLENIISNG
jgi:hypothetical protein